MRVFFKLLLCAYLFGPIAHFCKRQTDGFSILKISSSRPVHSDVVLEALPGGQRYHYLARGNQAFVFLSEDGKYVLKLFDQTLYRLPFWKFWKEKKKLKKADKLERDFASYQLAYDQLKEETGLVCVHLKKGGQSQKIVVVDKLNIEHVLDLSETEFVLQKRVDLLYPTLEKFVSKGEMDQARLALDSLLHLLKARSEKGIEDSPPDFDKNFGFSEGKAVQIDVGRFAKAEKVVAPPIKTEFRQWLTALSPDLWDYFSMQYQWSFQ